ncbi:MAG TPA: hypothetical protein VIA29_01670 [Thermoanaerobaculia bacterium]|jgi:hypothetical protein
MSQAPFYEETQGFGLWIWAVLGLVALLVVMLLSMRLSTRVDAEAVTVRYGFLYSARIPVSEIVKAQAVRYRPLRDYGGWGIRGSRRRRAVNARGDLGVLLHRTDGGTFLIGSQTPRELLAALARAGVETEDSLPIVVREV